MQRPTVSPRMQEYFKTLKTSVKKGHLGNASELLKCEISSNLQDTIAVI
jgi:hypothetical protein